MYVKMRCRSQEGEVIFLRLELAQVGLVVERINLVQQNYYPRGVMCALEGYNGH